MPGFNQTGPNGKGSMTGRRMGRCTNFGASSNNRTAETKENTYENILENIQGRGFGLGRGRGGRGFGRGHQNRFRGGF